MASRLAPFVGVEDEPGRRLDHLAVRLAAALIADGDVRIRAAELVSEVEQATAPLVSARRPSGTALSARPFSSSAQAPQTYFLIR